MFKQTVIFSTLLILVGLVGYFGTDTTSLTALIPTFLGIAMLAFATVGLSERWHKHAMHFVVLLSFLGFAATARGIGGSMMLLIGREVARPNAAIAQGLTAIICLTYCIQCIRWFRRNRRNRAPEVLGS